ncbi:MAG: FAD-dependent monooxygenase [Paracoccaceae bacterium]
MSCDGMKVAVVGGGIGGMAAAAAFARKGAQVVVYEQAPALTEVGAGLQISANGQALLRAVGAVQGVPEKVTVSQGTWFCDGSSGRRVAKVRSAEAGPIWYMHRADLLALLTDAARDAGVQVELGQYRVPGSLEADLVVASDGVRGTWRGAIDGPARPHFTGQVAWRALVRLQGAPLPPVAQVYMGTRAHVVLYPLRGGELANLVAIEERQGWLEEGWSLEGDPEELQTRFSDFHGDAGRVIGAVDRVYQWALHARPVAQHWHKDNAVLVGDAAHPTLPFFAQGACLALEDAAVLAESVAAGPEVGTALARYQSLRQDRATRVVGIASGNAWRFHLPKPWAWGAQMVLALGAGPLARRLEWVYAYDPTTVVSDGNAG